MRSKDKSSPAFTDPKNATSSPPPICSADRGTGDIWDAASSFRTLRHALYPLSYRRCRLAGFEPASSSLTAKHQISSPPLDKAVVGEQARTEWRPIRAQGARSCESEPETRVATPLARAPPRYADDRRREPQIEERLWSEGTVLFTTDRWFPGEQTTRLFFCRRNPRLHHLEFQNLLSFQFRCCGGAGNKNPSGAWARRGSIVSNCGRASAHPALARKRVLVTAQVERPVGIRLHDEWRGAHHQSLSLVAATIAGNGGGV